MNLNETTQKSILEEVRTAKRENAAEHGFDVFQIIEAARQRQEESTRPVIRKGIRGQTGEAAGVGERP